MKNIFFIIFLVLFIGLGFDFVQNLLKKQYVFEFYYGYLIVYSTFKVLRHMYKSPNINWVSNNQNS